MACCSVWSWGQQKRHLLKHCPERNRTERIRELDNPDDTEMSTAGNDSEGMFKVALELQAAVSLEVLKYCQAL
jgi:hypothetical protein